MKRSESFFYLNNFASFTRCIDKVCLNGDPFFNVDILKSRRNTKVSVMCQIYFLFKCFFAGCLKRQMEDGIDFVLLLNRTVYFIVYRTFEQYICCVKLIMKINSINDFKLNGR